MGWAEGSVQSPGSPAPWWPWVHPNRKGTGLSTRHCRSCGKPCKSSSVARRVAGGGCSWDGPPTPQRQTCREPCFGSWENGARG